jgi:uncharacterized protein YcbK (DUF882 family)
MEHSRSLYLVVRSIAVAALVALCSPSVAHAEPPPPQVLHPAAVPSPDAKPEMRTLHLKHHWTGETIEVVYRIGDAYQPEAMGKINHFLRDWRCNKSTEMDPKLIDRIYELNQQIGEDRTIKVVSAYRSEGYNASLLIAGRTVDPDSQHMYGRAVDLFVPGLKADKLKEAAEEQGLGGVGFYPYSGPRFVHLDTGPERHWTEMDPAVARRMGIEKRRRTRFELDCELTMAEVLQEVSPIDALSALPPGAAVNPAATFHKAAFSSPGEENAGADPALAGAAQGPCEAAAPLAPLELLSGLPDRQAQD